MKWLELHLDTQPAGIEPATELLSEYGIDSLMIDEEGDFKDFLENNHQYWDYVDDDLMEQMHGKSRITFYLEDSAEGYNTLAQFRIGLSAFKKQHPEYAPLILSMENVEDADWENNWKQFYKPMEIGERLLVVPEWEQAQEDGRVKSTLANGEELFSDEVLVAIGRPLNTRGMGLEEVGVKMEKHVLELTDEHMRTSVPNIFAAGDITVGTQLSDKAQRQGLVIAETIAGGDYYINYDAIPATMFMEPEIAMVGLTVSDAAERGIETISGSLPFSSNEKAMAIGKTEGLIKVVARKDDHVIIGAQIFGHEACDLIAHMTVEVENGLTQENVYNSIHPHPTVTEIILEVCKRAVGLSFDK